MIMAKPKGTRTSNIHTVSTPALQSVHFGRHSFDPRFDARTKEQKRIDDTIAQYEQKSSPLAPQVSLVDYEGYPFVTSMADRNAAGRILTSIDDVQLYRPVEQQGGQDYMFFNPGQVWASGRAPVSGIMTAAQIMREATGKNPLYLPWRMSPTGGDFGAIAGEAMLSHAESSLGSGLKRKIDRDIKKFIPNWKGIDSPESYDQFRAAPDKMRKALMHMMDKEYRDQGTLNYGQARLSATDPNQFNAPQLEIQNVGQIWADKPVIQKSGHSYYPFGVPGEGLGVIERPHNIYELLPQVAKDRGVIDPKNPSHDDRRSMESNIRAGIIDDKLLKSLGYAAGGLVDSAPEEAIKNTITDPQAFKMLDMDLANLALMSRQPPRRMADGGKMSKDEDLFALKPQPKPAVPTVRELVAEIGKSPSRYEAKYPAKDFTPLELQAYRLMQAAKATPDANRYLESLNPYFDSQLKFDIGAGSDAGYVEPKVPNLAVVQQLQDIKNTIPHELTHTLQLGKGKGTELERDRQVMQRAKALPIETQKTMMPSGNRYENMKETWANINARAHEVNAAGGDFINSPEGRALFPTPEMQREYYTRSMPGVNSLTPSTGTFVANTSAPVDRSKQSYAQQALRALGFAQGGIIHMAGGGRPPLRSLDEVPSDEYLKAEIARINAAPTVRANSADETANYARYVAERAGQPIEMPARPDYTPGFSVLEKPTYGSEVPGTTPTVDQQRYELTMRGQQEAANKRYRAQQGDALAGMDPTGTLAVTDAARTMGLGMLALPVHAGRTAFHYLQHGNMKDAPTGKDYEEFMSPRTAEGAELVEEIGTAGSRIMGAERGFGMNPNLWTYTPPTVAQMRAGLKLGAERAAPVLGKVDKFVREGYESGAIPQPGLSIKDVTPKALAPANEQGFYSPTEAAALNLQRKTGNGQAFLNDILKGENVRPDEIKAMGLDTFLKDKKNVTAAEVQDYISQNKLGLGEKLYESDETLYPHLELPGGENYREIALTLSNSNRGLSKAEINTINKRLIKKGFDPLAEDQQEVAMNGGNSAMGMLQDLEDRVGIKTNDLMKTMAGGNPDAQYRSSHWDEPNVLAHLRMSDRVTDGKKTLLIDEVQSDWHQAARDARTTEIKRLIDKGMSKEEAQKLTPENFGYYDPKKTWEVFDPKDGRAIASYATKKEAELHAKTSPHLDYDTAVTEKVPNAPYKEDWYQLALKRSIKEAIDGGYDRIALPTGARVAKRFHVVDDKGMIKYYDEIYPSYLKKFGKKYGATVGSTTVDANGVLEPLHYMEITPAMRKEFSTGIHMKKGGKVSFASNVDAMRHELTQRQ